MKLFYTITIFLAVGLHIVTCSALNPGQQRQLDLQLIEAAANGNFTGVKQAHADGAYINAYDDKALRFTVRGGYLDIAQFLLESGANIHADHDYALRAAAANHDWPMIDLLLHYGADRNKLTREQLQQIEFHRMKI